MASSEFNVREYWDKRFQHKWSLHRVGMVRLSHSFNRWIYRVRRRVFFRTARQMPLDLRRCDVLDIGSGTGFYVNLWQRLGARSVSGMDIADSAVAKLQKRFPDVRFERGDASDESPFEDESFDAVSAFDVLFHIVDDERYEHAIANVHRMLRPGGLFVLSENFVPKKKVSRKHYVNRSRDEILDILRRNGFQITHSRPMVNLMAPPVASTKRWRQSLWKRMLPALKRESLGNVAGALMYPIELLLTSVQRESSSVQIVVCQKVASDD